MLLTLTLVLVSALGAAPAADSVPGKWLITGDVAGNPVKTMCTISQAGTTLSGNCTNEAGAPYVLTGDVKDGKITFQYEVDYQGQTLQVVYLATLSPSPRAMKGANDVRPMNASGTFSAVPAPDK